MSRLLPLLLSLVPALLFTTSAAAGTTDISSNWAGYVASGTSFTTVSGSWVQPAASCSAGSSSAAFWVGLGGNGVASRGLEQIGTSSDCTAAGRARYSAWYELLPAGSVPIELKIAAGNRIWASVKVNGTKVTLAVENLTRKTSFTKTLTTATPDTSSAEWIAEAPSACDSYGRCRAVSLTNFGTIAFTRSLATAGGHTGTISDPLWTATAIELRSAGDYGPFASATSGAQAVPAALSSDGSGFAVSYGELAQAQPDPYGGYGGGPGYGGPGY